MAEDKTIIMPDNQNSGWGSVPAVWALNNGWGGYGNGWGGGFGSGLFGGSGFGAGILGGILGGLIPGFFGGWNGNGFGGFGMGNGAAAASLGAQATANNNTDTILRAIDGSDSDIRLLATTLNSDVDSIRLAINTVNGAIQTVGAQLGLTGQQVINAIQSGNADLAARLCSCCCEMKQLVTAQGYENQLATLRQTETLGSAIADLKSTMVDQFCQAEKREMQQTITRQGDVITQLRNEADNLRQTNMISAMLAPIAAEVNDIKCKLPATTTVQYPNLVAFSTTPNIGGFYGGFNGYGYGPGWGNGSYWG